MMRWLLLALLLGSASPAWATFAEVGSGSQRATTQVFNVNSTTLAYPASVSANTLLVVWGSAYADGSAPASVTVTGLQGAYTVVTCPSNFDTFINFIAYRRSTAAGSETVTVDPAGTGAYISFTVDEFSLANGLQPVLDATGACTNGTSAAVSGTVTTTTTANTLILGLVSGTEGQTITPGGSYTQAGEKETTHPHNAVFRVVTTAQSYTVDWTVGASVHWSMFAIAMREATADTQAPTQPQGLNCTGQTTTSVACTWSASTDNVGVVDYVLERSPAGCASFAQINIPVVTNYTDTGLTSNTTYCYRVSARDGASPQNVSLTSATTNGTTLADRQATLTWTNVGTYTSVVVERCAGASCSNFTAYATVGGTIQTYVDPTSPTPVAGYRVRATLTGAPDSAPSNIVYTTPSTPAVLSLSPPSLTYGATIGGSNPPAQALTITKAPGGPTMVWTLTDDAAWFSCTPASGTDTTVLSCSVNISGLSSGTQFATITVTAPGATGSPQTVLVTLNLAPQASGGTPPGQGRSGRVR